MLFLTDADIKKALPMREAIEVMRKTFAQAHHGRAVMPVRMGLPTRDGIALFMPAYLPDANALGQKTVSVFAGNAARGLPTIHALVTLMDAQTGAPLAVLEGGYLTRLRTGAVTGLACDILAAPDAATLTIIGAGGQAPTQIEAVCAARPIRKVNIVSRGDRAQKLAAELQAADASREFIPKNFDGFDCLTQADIIVTATTSRQPLFAGDGVKPGAVVAAIGAYTPEMREVDAALLNRSRVFVDDREAALAEAGDLLIPARAGDWALENIVCDLGALVCGHPQAHHDPRGVAFFKSCGLAIEDVACAKFVYDKLTEDERRRTI